MSVFQMLHVAFCEFAQMPSEKVWNTWHNDSCVFGLFSQCTQHPKEMAPYEFYKHVL